MILFYVTHHSKKAAHTIAQHLLKKHLIACANIFPITSQYWWKGRIQSSREFVTLLKTQKRLAKTVEAEIKRIHLYNTLCIIKILGKANKEFENWIEEETAV